MTHEYFLGANSSRGFYSLYSSFCSGEGDYLHIIKGGPGTGKSSFMRRIAKAAEERGYNVEYVLCSGDPDSLDGLYIPALRRGWVDGTAPHVTEPRCFGCDGDYVNLGLFCRTPISPEASHYVSLLNQRYKACYSTAYDYLKAAALLRKDRLNSQLQPRQQNEIRGTIQAILDDAGEKQKGTALFIPRFLHALCCKGDLYLKDSISQLCKRCYVVSNNSEASTVLRIAAELASGYVSKLIVCPDPLEPELFEAVLLPELELGFVSAAYGIEWAEELLPADILSGCADEICSEPESRVRTMARDNLRQAKELHDELEDLYKEAMDFAALDAFTEDYVKTAMD